jgi:hypothetical protein
MNTDNLILEAIRTSPYNIGYSIRVDKEPLSNVFIIDTPQKNGDVYLCLRSLGDIYNRGKHAVQVWVEIVNTPYKPLKKPPSIVVDDEIAAIINVFCRQRYSPPPEAAGKPYSLQIP